MKSLISIAILSVCLCVAFGEEETPTGPLFGIEKKFAGKWKGSRNDYRWEIDRKEDRSFEIVFTEPNPDDGGVVYRNYATGRWWVVDGVYKFEWEKWWGDPGNFSGVIDEEIELVEDGRIVTITEDDGERENVEVRVSGFKMKEWAIKKMTATLKLNPE